MEKWLISSISILTLTKNCLRFRLYLVLIPGLLIGSATAAPSAEESVKFINDKIIVDASINTHGIHLEYDKCQLSMYRVNGSPVDKTINLSDVNLSGLENIEIESLVKPWDRHLPPSGYIFHVNLMSSKHGTITKFSFRGEDSAKRVARAFHFLAKKCGAKEELF